MSAPKAPKRATLVDPGQCEVCGGPRVGAIYIADGGKSTAQVYCLDHHRQRPESVVFSVHLDDAGRLTLWAARGRALDFETTRAVEYAFTELRRAHRQRGERLDKIAAGPWRLYVDGGTLRAPRPPGETRGPSWPMVKATLGSSKFTRPCVCCGAKLENRAPVYRAEKRKGDRDWTDHWSSTVIAQCIACQSCGDFAIAADASAGVVAASILSDLLASGADS